MLSIDIKEDRIQKKYPKEIVGFTQQIHDVERKNRKLSPVIKAYYKYLFLLEKYIKKHNVIPQKLNNPFLYFIYYNQNLYFKFDKSLS